MPKYRAMCNITIETGDIAVSEDEIGEALAEVIDGLDGGLDLAVNNPNYLEDADPDEDDYEDELLECEFQIEHVGIITGSIKLINEQEEG